MKEKELKQIMKMIGDEHKEMLKTLKESFRTSKNCGMWDELIDIEARMDLLYYYNEYTLPDIERKIRERLSIEH